jgi:fatty acid desaturase
MSPLIRFYSAAAAMVVVMFGTVFPAIKIAPLYFPSLMAPLLIVGVALVFGLWIYLTSIKCPNCSEKLHDGGFVRESWPTRYCSHCGYDLKKRQT